MSPFPYRKCDQPWELFRNESLEGQNRRKAIANSRALVDRDRRRENGLWWDAQKYIDQVVPAEFITPSEIDTFNYRYQVYARPPPIQCTPRSLNEVTDTIPPIRYNVKRVAVDKPFRPLSFECPGSRCKQPFMLRKNNTLRCTQDCSKNNNTKQRSSEVRAACGDTNQCHVARSESQHPLVPAGKSFTVSKEPILNKAEHKASWSDTSNPPRRLVSARRAVITHEEPLCKGVTDIHLNENNSKMCLDMPTRSKPEQCISASHNDDKQFSQSVKQKSIAQDTLLTNLEAKDKAKASDHGDLHKQRSLINHSLDQTYREENASHDFLTDTARHYTDHPPTNGQSACNSNRCYLPATNSNTTDNVDRSASESHCKVNSVTDAPFGTRKLPIIQSQKLLSPSGQRSPRVFRSNSSLSSRAGSTYSNSTINSSWSARKPCALLSPHEPIRGANAGKNQKDLARSRISLSRESVASLLSHNEYLSPPSPVPPAVGKGKRKCQMQTTINDQESVASLLTNRNCNNVHGSTMILSGGAFQDMFADLIPPATPETGISVKTCRYKSVPRQIHYEDEKFCSAEEKLDHGNKIKAFAHPLCTNNNASVEQKGTSGKYMLKCCPLKQCGTLGQNVFDPEASKVICRFHGKRPAVNDDQPILLEQVKPVDITTGEVKSNEDPQTFQCRTTISCATGEPMKDLAGPLMVCESKQPTTSKIGYGTYKIVGGVQYKEAPPPNNLKDLRLPPHLEEYREFTRRCPDYRKGRFDRSDPLNVMLLPSQKSSILLSGRGQNPFPFCKMPRRNLPSLFQPVKTSSDLRWRLPGFFAKQ
ncbi:hypothetical protein PoB_002044200 [Plakobranchus ocellatus]|uniref:Uncharacterized protein n=1 Tax=Plakobranchus ocellatus TaxID=259542 RepID=A0AAV3ZHC2_9GAST|nr:hypothetical protein PoB_002044200 [Plakobranchus ocellatus]